MLAENKARLTRFVNAITVFGGALSGGAIAFAFEGYEQTAWLLLGAALIIDSIDGTIVRYFGLSGSLPRYDGARLDEYADLMTFVLGPVAFAWAADLLPFDWLGILTGMVVIGVSCLQFSRTDNKTENAFWGWPSYWNIVYFYAWALALDSMAVVALSLVLSGAVFAPIPFAYPSKLDALRKVTWTLFAFWIAILLGYLVHPGFSEYWLWGSLAFPIYYFGLSLVLHRDLKADQPSGGA